MWGSRLLLDLSGGRLTSRLPCRLLWHTHPYLSRAAASRQDARLELAADQRLLRAHGDAPEASLTTERILIIPTVIGYGENPDGVDLTRRAALAMKAEGSSANCLPHQGMSWKKGLPDGE